MTPSKFKKWIKKHGLTYAKAGELLGYEVNHKRYECTTINRMVNGTWVGWSNKMDIIGLEAKMKFVENTYLQTPNRSI